MEAAGAVGAITLLLLNLQRTVGFHAPDLERVVPLLEGPIVTPDHPGRFREWRPQLGFLPLPLVFLVLLWR